MKMPFDRIDEIFAEVPKSTETPATDKGSSKPWDSFYYAQLTKQWCVKNGSGSFKPMNERLVAKHLEVLGYEGGKGVTKVNEVMIEKL